MIELIDCEESHRWLLHEWRSSDEVRPYMHDRAEISRETHDAWYTQLLRREGRMGWIIAMDGKPVGAAFVTQHDHENRRATWAFYLADPSTRGRRGQRGGVPRPEHAFGELGLHKLCCEVLSFNTAVVAMHKKFGFVEEGPARSLVPRREWVDTHVLAMFEDTWAERRKHFGERLRSRADLMQETIRFASTPVGEGHPPFIVAEMSGNHNGDLDRALDIVRASAEAGAHALKAQTYTADTITVDVDSRRSACPRGTSLWRPLAL